MDGDIRRIDGLTSPEVDSLDRATTLFAMCVSPLEVHGPHLPLGTDVTIAEAVCARTLGKLRLERPYIEPVLFPSFYMGSDTIPGSVEVNAKALYHLIRGNARFLARRGFRYLLVVDNHGGPRHQIATAKAVRESYAKDGFRVIAPFLSFYRRMVELDPALTEALGAGPGACGDADDCHAGLNETSLMLVADPGSVRPAWSGLPRTSIRKGRWPGMILGGLGRFLKALGLDDLGADTAYLGVMLSWVTEREPPTYIGEPRAASAEAGDRMLDLFSDSTLDEVLPALDGKPPYYTPIGWSLRWLAGV